MKKNHALVSNRKKSSSDRRIGRSKSRHERWHEKVELCVWAKLVVGLSDTILGTPTIHAVSARTAIIQIQSPDRILNSEQDKGGHVESFNKSMALCTSSAFLTLEMSPINASMSNFQTIKLVLAQDVSLVCIEELFVQSRFRRIANSCYYRHNINVITS